MEALVKSAIQCAVPVLEAPTQNAPSVTIGTSSIVQPHVQRLVLTKPTATARPTTAMLAPHSAQLVTHKTSACHVNEAGT